MESRDEMLARHARELAEMESRWWEECFTEDPIENWSAVRRNDQYTMDWIKNNLPSIIRKREKIGVTFKWYGKGNPAIAIWGDGLSTPIPLELAEKLAGRTLAPWERVEI